MFAPFIISRIDLSIYTRIDGFQSIKYMSKFISGYKSEFHRHLMPLKLQILALSGSFSAFIITIPDIYVFSLRYMADIFSIFQSFRQNIHN